MSILLPKYQIISLWDFDHLKKKKEEKQKHLQKPFDILSAFPPVSCHKIMLRLPY